MAGGPEMFEAKPPRFFKVIVEEILSEKRLLLPKRFALKYGKDLSDPVVLKVPCGSEWQIGLTKGDGKVWLEKGWQEFADHYSLAYAYFLVFEYEDNCHFNVLIYDKGAAEIDYPPRHSEEPGEEAAANQSKEDLSLFERGGGGMSTTIGSMQPLENSEKADALRKSDFKSFKVSMKPSYVCTGFRLTVPGSFAQKYFTNTYGNVILCGSDGTTWPAKYYCYRNKDGNVTAKIIHGWREFSEGNNLKVRDVCAFELVDGSKMSLKVAIFRSTEKAKPNNMSLGKLRKPRLKISSSRLITEVLKAQRDFISTYPFFEVVLRSNYLQHSSMYVPFEFAERHIKDEKYMTLQVADKSWPVNLISYPSRRIYRLCGGWGAFKTANSLRVGDGLALELIKSDVLKVTIFRNSD